MSHYAERGLEIPHTEQIRPEANRRPTISPEEFAARHNKLKQALENGIALRLSEKQLGALLGLYSDPESPKSTVEVAHDLGTTKQNVHEHSQRGLRRIDRLTQKEQDQNNASSNGGRRGHSKDIDMGDMLHRYFHLGQTEQQVADGLSVSRGTIHNRIVSVGVATRRRTGRPRMNRVA